MHLSMHSSFFICLPTCESLVFDSKVSAPQIFGSLDSPCMLSHPFNSFHMFSTSFQHVSPWPFQTWFAESSRVVEDCELRWGQKQWGELRCVNLCQLCRSTAAKRQGSGLTVWRPLFFADAFRKCGWAILMPLAWCSHQGVRPRAQGKKR